MPFLKASPNPTIPSISQRPLVREHPSLYNVLKACSVLSAGHLPCIRCYVSVSHLDHEFVEGRIMLIYLHISPAFSTRLCPQEMLSENGHKWIEKGYELAAYGSRKPSHTGCKVTKRLISEDYVCFKKTYQKTQKNPTTKKSYLFWLLKCHQKTLHFSWSLTIHPSKSIQITNW